LQFFLYVLLMGVLYLLVAGRYHEPFWGALGWTFPIPRAWLCLIAGPALTITLSVLGVLMKAPTESSLIEEMITSRASLALFIVFGVVFAPIFEELLFRGFLFPLLARSMGPWLGIAFTALLFGLLHGAQNHWAWQQMVLIGAAGAAFGYARYQTGSTTAGFLMHAAYNATAFAGYTLSHWRVLS
jgi:membrane protease YdiL (CAAX protease family)